MLVPHDSTPRTLNDNPSFGEQAKQLVTEQTLQSQFRSGSHSNKLFFANRDGGSMLQRLESLERLEKLFEDSQATIKQQAAEFDARQQALENRVEHQAAEFDARQQTLESKVEHHAALLRTVEPYALDVRNRWMSENSMNLKKEYPEDEGIKKRVSAAVHSAEAYLDSLLYHKPDHTDGDTAEIKCMRSDSDTYTEIYGIKWKDVYFLGSISSRSYAIYCEVSLISFVGQYFCGLSAINRRGTLNYLKHSGVKTDKRRYDKMQEEVLDFNTKYDKFLTKTKKYLELKRGLEGDDDRDGFERLQMDKRKEVEDTLEKVKQLALACVQKEKLPC